MKHAQSYSLHSTQSLDATIAAIATAPGQGGVAIIRISGAEAWAIASDIFVSAKTLKAPEFKPNRIYHGLITRSPSPSDVPNALPNEFIDDAIVLVFKGPKSFTGQDVIEIQGHGGDYLSHLILERCIQAGARLAQPGEFTKRAFLSGKLDLTQAESIMDLVSADNERLITLASENLKNRSLGKSLDTMRDHLIQLQTKLIAHTDFPDEVDPPDREDSQAGLEALVAQVSQLAQSAESNRLLREGYHVAILGLPNSGKSSLFNALLAAERAIVTEIAGTTRDVISESLLIEGVRVTLFDTAGIREAENTVEQIGIERSWQAAKSAQAVLFVYDSTLRKTPLELTPDDTHILNQVKASGIPVLLLANKTDLLPQSLFLEAMPQTENQNHTPVFVSVKSGEGLSSILQWLGQRVKDQQESHSTSAVSLNQRQRRCVNSILEHLSLARQTLANAQIPLDLCTIPISDALYEFDKLNGHDTTESVLDEVFSQFCVGK